MNNNLDKLIEIVKKLRAPNGCDWDREQTHQSLIPYLLEETYEVIEAVEQKDYKLLKEELGDLLLHIIFQIDISEENKKFHLNDVIDGICEKLIRRHPHIFYDKDDPRYKEGDWELSKQKEKNRSSVLDGVPIALPALVRASRIQEKAAAVGFDWEKKEQVLLKVDEEIEELKEAIINNDGIEEELGDVFFTIVNLSRHLGYESEGTLKKSIDKFSNRFKKIEKYLKSQNVNMKDLSLDELDDIWEKNKQ
tara:strand:- start:9 stop:758 length:750 start_codon:yes stop_codon:yes gene_type:complete